MASNSTDVYIKLNTGKSTLFTVSIYDRVEVLCDLVAKQERVGSRQVMLKYQGKQLDKYKTIQEYGIRIETILVAQILIPHDVTLILDLPNDNKEEMLISSLDSVTTLYTNIATRLWTSTDAVQLYVKDRSMPTSSCTIENSGLLNGCVVKVTLQDKNVSSEPIKDDIKEMIMSSFSAANKKVEVVFSFDTTGSMYSYLTTVREKLGVSCTRLIQDIPNIRIGIIAHGDYCDSESMYALRYTELTSNVHDLVEFAMNVPATSGGDSPECYELVLQRAQQLDWSEDSAKALVLIGDNHPHPPSYTDQRLRWHDDLDLLTGMGIKVYGVQAGNDSESKHFYQELAEVSGGCYLKLDHIDVITDMFLAVCYQETDVQLLENFEQELAAAGDATQKSQALINQMKQETHFRKDEKQKITSNSSKRYVPQPWWDTTIDRATPTYKYSQDTDKWTLVRSTPLLFESTTYSTMHTTSLGIDTHRRKKTKKRCMIM
nr:hypothetical protein BgiMline_001767 [Biomphalaria glabrata]